MAPVSERSFQRAENVPRLPLLTSRGQRMLASAAKELSAEARDGVRNDGSINDRRMSGLGLSLDLDSSRRLSQSARPSLGGLNSTWSPGMTTPHDIMASGPQTLTVASARGRRKGVHTGVCSAKLSAEEQMDHELRQVCEQIGLKAAQKFSTVREAFRFLDSDHDGKISRSEMQYFFRAYNIPGPIADRFFDHLDRDKSGEVQYQEFMRYVAPYVQPTQIEGSVDTTECSSNASTRTPSPSGGVTTQKTITPEIKAMLEFIAKKSQEKFSHAREVFRCVDCNDDGSITRKEMQYFFRVFNMPEVNADTVFDHLTGDTSLDVNYYEFVRFLGPYLELPGTQATMLQRPEGQPPSNRPSRRSSIASGSKTGSVPKNSRSPSISESSDILDRDLVQKPEVHEMTQAQLEKEMCDVMKDIGEKLPLKFKHVRDAFRPLDLSHNGKITQSEMRSFLRGFGWPHDVADRFFRALDEDASGEIDFNSFIAHFDVVLGPANRPAQRGNLVDLSDESDVHFRQEVNQVAAVLSEKLLTKFSSARFPAREALRTLDLSNDGKITLQDMKLFFRTMCMPSDGATKLFKWLCKEGADYVAYDDFLALFGTVKPGGGRWRAVQELDGMSRPSGPPAWTIR